MIYLLFSILSSIILFIFFKISEKYKANSFNLIIINYVIATALGIWLYNKPISLTEICHQPWFYHSILIGGLLIFTFLIIALSTQKVGVSVTTVASKMSLIIPVTFSIIYFSEAIQILKVVGIITALIAVLLTIYKKRDSNFGLHKIILPIILFFGIGTIDALVKYSQQTFKLSDETSSLFSAVLFAFAGIIGLLINIINYKTFKNYKKFSTIILGVILGIVNFCTVYFLINALDSNIFDSSIIFGINNIGIVGGSVLIGVFFFREKISLINYLGIALSVIAIVLLSYS